MTKIILMINTLDHLPRAIYGQSNCSPGVSALPWKHRRRSHGPSGAVRAASPFHACIRTGPTW